MPEKIEWFYLDWTKYEFDWWGTDYSWVEKEVEDVWYDYSAIQWPAPDGFHVPSRDEWLALLDVLTSTFSMASNATTIWTYLKMPMAGDRRVFSDVYNVGSCGFYWYSTPYITSAYNFMFDSSQFYLQWGRDRAQGNSIRCFKDSPTIPTPSRIMLYDGSNIATGAWVFWNNTDWLISISWDGVTWFTIMDKNLWATTVYNQGDTLTDDNCGYFYQWGNNYGFPHSWTITTTRTKVDASTYWPWNYYKSSTFIIYDGDWSSVHNANLWGGVTWVQPLTWFELSLRTITREPSDDFTLIAPSSIKDWEEYALRCVNVDSHTMALWKWFTNPFWVDLTLSANATDQFVFLAVQWTLELQPQVVISNWTVSQLVAWTTASSDPTIATLITNS